LVVIAIIALLISILLPSLSRARELSKRLVCASNVKGIGTSAKIYANENAERWPVPAFRNGFIDGEGIEFTKADNGRMGSGQIGYKRLEQTTSETPMIPNAGSVEVSVTRAYWMLVRSGDITTTQFICPSSGAEIATGDIEEFYDFDDTKNISYGYQVPFGPRDTRPREGMDNRQVIAADRGPFYLSSTGDPPFKTAGQNGTDIGLQDPPKNWRAFNSQNHGGGGAGEGQNCLFADGHATFARLPAVGIDNDNIYTKIDGTAAWVPQGYNRIHGQTPHQTSKNTYPGQNVLGNGAGRHSTTDTLIYP
ncbi:MAG: hypothetical protein AABZ47_06530, partial [Planctomycetota bacterium]